MGFENYRDCEALFKVRRGAWLNAEEASHLGVSPDSSAVKSPSPPLHDSAVLKLLHIPNNIPIILAKLPFLKRIVDVRCTNSAIDSCLALYKIVNYIGVEFWFCLGGGSYLVTLRWVRGHAPGKFLKLGALKLHFQHSENTFSEIDIFYIFKTTFYCCMW